MAKKSKASKDLFKNITTLKGLDTDYQFVSTGSLVLDSILGGGMLSGRIIEFYGDESTGKSLIAGTSVKYAVENNRLAVIYDTENVLTNADFLNNVIGVDINKVIVRNSYVANGKIFTVESICEEIEKLSYLYEDKELQKQFSNSLGFDVSKTDGITVVWDSLAATPTEDMLESSYYDVDVAKQARAVSAGFRKLISHLSRANISLLITNQTRTNMNLHFGGQKISTPGGKALKFYASQRVKLNKMGKIKEFNTFDKEVIVGNNILAKVTKNKVKKPFCEGYLPIYFDSGIIESLEVYDHALTLGIIHKTGRGRGVKYFVTVMDDNDQLQDIEFSIKDWEKFYYDNKDKILKSVNNYYNPVSDRIDNILKTESEAEVENKVKTEEPNKLTNGVYENDEDEG